MLFNEQHAHNDANDSIRPSDTEELARMEAGFSRAVAEELYSKCDQDRDGSLTSLGPETRRPCALVLARRGELPGHRMACVRQLGHGGPSVARRNLPLLLRLRACRLSFQETDVPERGAEEGIWAETNDLCRLCSLSSEEEDISWSDDWKSEVSKLLKRRGFKEEEEGHSAHSTFGFRGLVLVRWSLAGLKYHATNAAGESVALREILKDKTASLDSKHFPITLHLQAPVPSSFLHTSCPVLKAMARPRT